MSDETRGDSKERARLLWDSQPHLDDFLHTENEKCLLLWIVRYWD
jgi:hypothetical protein